MNKNVKTITILKVLLKRPLIIINKLLLGLFRIISKPLIKKIAFIVFIINLINGFIWVVSGFSIYTYVAARLVMTFPILTMFFCYLDDFILYLCQKLGITLQPSVKDGVIIDESGRKRTTKDIHTEPDIQPTKRLEEKIQELQRTNEHLKKEKRMREKQLQALYEVFKKTGKVPVLKHISFGLEADPDAIKQYMDASKYSDNIPFEYELEDDKSFIQKHPWITGGIVVATGFLVWYLVDSESFKSAGSSAAGMLSLFQQNISKWLNISNSTNFEDSDSNNSSNLDNLEKGKSRATPNTLDEWKAEQKRLFELCAHKRQAYDRAVDAQNIMLDKPSEDSLKNKQIFLKAREAYLEYREAQNILIANEKLSLNPKPYVESSSIEELNNDKKGTLKDIENVEKNIIYDQKAYNKDNSTINFKLLKVSQDTLALMQKDLHEIDSKLLAFETINSESNQTTPKASSSQLPPTDKVFLKKDPMLKPDYEINEEELKMISDYNYEINLYNQNVDSKNVWLNRLIENNGEYPINAVQETYQAHLRSLEFKENLLNGLKNDIDNYRNEQALRMSNHEPSTEWEGEVSPPTSDTNVIQRNPSPISLQDPDDTWTDTRSAPLTDTDIENLARIKSKYHNTPEPNVDFNGDVSSNYSSNSPEGSDYSSEEESDTSSSLIKQNRYYPLSSLSLLFLKNKFKGKDEDEDEQKEIKKYFIYSSNYKEFNTLNFFYEALSGSTLNELLKLRMKYINSNIGVPEFLELMIIEKQVVNSKDEFYSEYNLVPTLKVIHPYYKKLLIIERDGISEDDDNNLARLEENGAFYILENFSYKQLIYYRSLFILKGQETPSDVEYIIEQYEINSPNTIYYYIKEN
jgi:hypothetical protein